MREKYLSQDKARHIDGQTDVIKYQTQNNAYHQFTFQKQITLTQNLEAVTVFKQYLKCIEAYDVKTIW